MRFETEETKEFTPNKRPVLVLETAIATWDAARLAFQHERCKQYQDEYMRASDELGQAIGSWARSEPELAYQFGLWFQSHEADWDGE